MDHLPFDRVDLLYVPIDSGCQWHDVPVDLRIVTTFIKNGIKNEPSRQSADYESDRRDKDFGASCQRFDATCENRYSSCASLLHAMRSAIALPLLRNEAC